MTIINYPIIIPPMLLDSDHEVYFTKNVSEVSTLFVLVLKVLRIEVVIDKPFL